MTTTNSVPGNTMLQLLQAMHASESHFEQPKVGLIQLFVAL